MSCRLRARQDPPSGGICKLSVFRVGKKRERPVWGCAGDWHDRGVAEAGARPPSRRCRRRTRRPLVGTRGWCAAGPVTPRRRGASAGLNLCRRHREKCPQSPACRSPVRVSLVTDGTLLRRLDASDVLTLSKTVSAGVSSRDTPAGAGKPTRGRLIWQSWRGLLQAAHAGASTRAGRRAARFAARQDHRTRGPHDGAARRPHDKPHDKAARKGAATSMTVGVTAQTWPSRYANAHALAGRWGRVRPQRQAPGASVREPAAVPLRCGRG